jgi:hypothetical protein
VAYPAVVDKSRIYSTPPYSKLRLIKISVKMTDKENEGFAYLRQNFPKTSWAFSTNEIIIRPPII